MKQLTEKLLRKRQSLLMDKPIHNAEYCSGKCTGGCCRDFTLPFTPEQLDEHYETWMKFKETGKHEGKTLYQDIPIIYSMLIFLRTDNYNLNGEYETKKPVHHYTCRHHDSETGKCKIYLMRPHFCRTFPDGTKNLESRVVSFEVGTCQYAGCTFKQKPKFSLIDRIEFESLKTSSYVKKKNTEESEAVPN